MFFRLCFSLLFGTELRFFLLLFLAFVFSAAFVTHIVLLGKWGPCSTLQASARHEESGLHPEKRSVAAARGTRREFCSIVPT